MQMTFVGGPWDGASCPCPVTLPDRIEGPDQTVYVSWNEHPAVAGILAEPLADAYTFAAAALSPRELLERVEHLQSLHEQRSDPHAVRLSDRAD